MRTESTRSSGLVLVGAVAFALWGAGACSSTPAEEPGNNPSGGSGSGGSRGGGESGSAGSGGSGDSGGGGGGSGGSNAGGAGGSSAGAGGSTGSAGAGGGAGAGGAAMPPMGGSPGADAAPPDMAPACPVEEPPAGNRCVKITKAMGNEPNIDNFEPGPNHTPTCHKIRDADGRSGLWNSGKDTASPMGVVNHTFEAPGAEAAPGSTQALRLSGTGLNDWGAYLAVPLGPCYDASEYDGISFWLKGDPSKAPEVKISFITPFTAVAAEGGACVPDAKECYDHMTVGLFKVSNTWTRYAISWQQLGQGG